MPGPSVNPVDAARAIEMNEAGFTGNMIASSLGLARSTVRDIFNGVGHWGELAEKPVFARWRVAQSQALEASARAVAAVAIEQTLEAMPKASALQAATVFAIMVDKSRLLAGESTANIAIDMQVHAVDDLAGILSQALLVNPVDNSQVK